MRLSKGSGEDEKGVMNSFDGTLPPAKIHRRTISEQHDNQPRVSACKEGMIRRAHAHGPTMNGSSPMDIEDPTRTDDSDHHLDELSPIDRIVIRVKQQPTSESRRKMSTDGPETAANDEARHECLKRHKPSLGTAPLLFLACCRC